MSLILEALKKSEKARENRAAGEAAPAPEPETELEPESAPEPDPEPKPVSPGLLAEIDTGALSLLTALLL